MIVAKIWKLTSFVMQNCNKVVECYSISDVKNFNKVDRDFVIFVNKNTKFFNIVCSKPKKGDLQHSQKESLLIY